LHFRCTKRNCKQWKRVYVQVNDWNSTERVEEWRKAWADVCNRKLEIEGVGAEKKIDHRSYARQGIEQKPTVHEGFAARAIEAQGEKSDRCEQNRIIAVLNRIMAQLAAISRLMRLRAKEEQEEKAKIEVKAEIKPSFDRLVTAAQEYEIIQRQYDWVGLTEALLRVLQT